MERFELDETKAAAWLARAVDAFDNGPICTDPDAEALPEFSRSWSTADDYDGITAREIVRAAQDAGLLTPPAGGEIDYEYNVDEDGGSGHWLIAVNAGDGRSLYLGHGWHRAWKLAETLKGADAGLEVLRAAERAGNAVLDDLAAYVAAR